MSANTKIEWADHTFNPWIGCTKVSPGCDNCYAEAREDKRLHRVQWGPGQPRSRTKTWGDPVRWNKAAFYRCACGWRGADAKQWKGTGICCPACEGRIYPARQRVFCASLADVFDNEVPTEWRNDLFDLIRATPNLDWLLLTKRIGNVAKMLPSATSAVPAHLFAEQWPHVWIGATIINQEEADRDIPKLLAVPAAKRFLSMEPLLGPVDLEDLVIKHAVGEQHFSALQCDDDEDPDWHGATVDWVIVGGESGPKARPMHPDWARSLRDQCEAAGVPFLFKQWGEWVDADNGPEDDAPYEGKAECWAHIEGGHHDGAMSVDFFNTYPMYRVGKKTAGRILDGRTWDGVPS